MLWVQMILYFAVSFLASVAGAICGIGGGILVKPTLDLFGFDSVAVISFLSGTMVLSMSAYSVGKSFLSRERSVDPKTATPLALGAAVGGVLGQRLFALIRASLAAPSAVGAVQAALLTLMTLMTLLYTVFKKRITPHAVSAPPLYVLIGLLLGLVSSFLGIGGGPINLVVLHFLFGMETKRAASNSLYIILFGQLASLISTVISRSVPDFEPLVLVVMVLGGILGGMIGRKINRRMDNGAVDRLFVLMMAAIIAVGIYNTVKFAWPL